MKQTNISVTIVRVGVNVRHTATLRIYTGRSKKKIVMNVTITFMKLAAPAKFVAVTELTKPAVGDGGFGHAAIFCILQHMSSVTVPLVRMVTKLNITA